MKLCDIARLPVERSLIELHVEGAVTSAEDLLCLTNYTCLKQLHIQVSADEEATLAQMVSDLPELRVLELRWLLETESYTEPLHGQIFNAISAAPELSELHLSQVRIRTSELIEILKSIGTRSTSFRDKSAGPGRLSAGAFYDTLPDRVSI